MVISVLPLPIYYYLMFKTICLFLLAFLATCFTIKDDDCSHDLEVYCIDDFNKGNDVLNQLSRFVPRPLNPRARISTSSALNISPIWIRSAGRVSA